MVILQGPQYCQVDQQMYPEDVAATKKIAAVRIHVERKIERVKDYQIISGGIDNTLFDSVEPLVFVCSMLTNFQSPLVA